MAMPRLDARAAPPTGFAACLHQQIGNLPAAKMPTLGQHRAAEAISQHRRRRFCLGFVADVVQRIVDPRLRASVSGNRRARALA